MVLAQYLIRKFEKREEERGIQIGEERGIETGRELERGTWLTWYKNMKDAEARGEPFDEPSPSDKR